MDKFIQENLIKLAEGTKEMLSADYNLAGVEKLYVQIESFRGMYFTLKEEVINDLAAGFGAYLGECIIKTYGGKWSFDDEHGYMIYFNSGNFVLPIDKVKAQIENGPKSSVIDFFKSIKVIFKDKKEK